MMNSKNWLRLAATTLTLSMTACDPADEAGDTDESMVSFRDGDGPWLPPKLNTNFLGEDETIPFSAIPLFDDPDAEVRLHAVWTQKCIGTGGSPLPEGLYFTSDLVGNLGISLNGEGKLNPARFTKYGDPGTTCTVSGGNWVGTVWAVMIDNGAGGWDNHYLMITAMDTDDKGTPRYQWSRYVGAGDSFSPKYYTPTCAEEEFVLGAQLVHSNYAYLLNDLMVDDESGNGSGDFSVAPGMMYMACLSGMVGKTAYWDYKPWRVGMEVHERATRVGRADYCGTGQSFTEAGNPLQIRDKYTEGGWDEDFPIEAAWEGGRAICIDTPRHIPLRGTSIKCGNQTLKPCTEHDTNNAEFVTRIAHWPVDIEP